VFGEFLVCCFCFAALVAPRVMGVAFIVSFDADAVISFSDLKFCPVWLGSFCLESLILAQDERWRRA
jgi:hypothetical protein